MEEDMEISLAPFYEEAARLQQAVEEAEVALQTARGAASEHDAKTKQEITLMLQKGCVTTNRIEASVIALFGPIREVIAKILVWNASLQTNAGNYLLIAVAHEVPLKCVMIHTPAHPSTYSTRHTVWLGKLTGESMIVDTTRDSGVELTLPVKRFVKWGESGEIVRTLEPLKLGSITNLSAMMGGLTSEGLLMAVAGLDLGLGDDTKIYIGPVAGESLGSIAGKVGSFGSILRYLDALEKLEETTEIEKILAGNI